MAVVAVVVVVVVVALVVVVAVVVVYHVYGSRFKTLNLNKAPPPHLQPKASHASLRYMLACTHQLSCRVAWGVGGRW